MSSPDHERETAPILRDDAYVHKVIAENVWRKAIHVDGEFRWVDNLGAVGELVPTDRVWKMRSFGEYMLLSPKETTEEPDASTALEEFDPKAVMADDTLTEEEKFEALLEYAVSMTLKDEPLADEQPPGEDFRTDARLNLRKEFLKMQLRRRKHGMPETSEDGFVAVDIHGYFDVDYDHPGPVLKKETQWIDKGYTVLKTVDQIAELNRREARLTEALMPKWRTRYSGKTDDGNESTSSEVSQDHCRKSPHYPACEDSCWLKSKHSSEEEIEMPQSSTVPSTNSSIYKQLESDHMRILILSAGDGKDELVCRLEGVKLPTIEAGTPSHVDFEALSYTWGDPEKTHTIICNGKAFGVTTNLFEALSYLRNPSSARTLWVDALCINQDDTDERNEQVRHMLTIYQSAVRVVVWLGLPLLGGSFAVAAMDHMKIRENRHLIFRKDHESGCMARLQKLVSILDDFVQRP